MADDLPEPARALLRQQQRVITRQQALAAGLTRKSIEIRLASGRWQRLQTGVYATFSGEPPRQAWLWAAVLRSGREAALSHQTAAELHRLLDTPAPLIHVTVPNGRQVTRPRGVRLHYSGRLAVSRHPALTPPRTRLEDTVLDLAAEAASLDEAIGVMLQAVGRRLTTPGKLLAATESRSRLRWREDLTQAVQAADDGVHSLIEFRYLTRVERPHGLPRGRRQRPVVRAGRREYQDIAYDAYRTVVEIDGRVAHPEEARWRDRRRDNVNAAYGLTTIRLGYVDVSHRACLSAAVVASTLTRRGWEGTPRRCGPDCQLPRS